MLLRRVCFFENSDILGNEWPKTNLYITDN